MSLTSLRTLQNMGCCLIEALQFVRGSPTWVVPDARSTERALLSALQFEAFKLIMVRSFLQDPVLLIQGLSRPSLQTALTTDELYYIGTD